MAQYFADIDSKIDDQARRVLDDFPGIDNTPLGEEWHLSTASIMQLTN